MICQRNGALQKNGVANKINLVMDYYPAEQRLNNYTNDTTLDTKCHLFNSETICKRQRQLPSSCTN